MSINIFSLMKIISQVGIVAWGISCGKAGIPGVYADVTKALCFIDWASKCELGQDFNFFKINKCDKWEKTQLDILNKNLKDLE